MRHYLTRTAMFFCPALAAMVIVVLNGHRPEIAAPTPAAQSAPIDLEWLQRHPQQPLQTQRQIDEMDWSSSGDPVEQSRLREQAEVWNRLRLRYQFRDSLPEITLPEDAGNCPEKPSSGAS